MHHPIDSLIMRTHRSLDSHIMRTHGPYVPTAGHIHFNDNIFILCNLNPDARAVRPYHLILHSTWVISMGRVGLRERSNRDARAVRSYPKSA